MECSFAYEGSYYVGLIMGAADFWKPPCVLGLGVWGAIHVEGIQEALKLISLAGGSTLI